MQETTTHWRSFAEYAPGSGPFDEMVSEGGALRPHCATLVKALESLGAAELSARLETARRTIHDHDVTYNVYGDPRGMDRPWQLDMVPLLVPPPAWTRVETAIIQRAHLLNLILTDVYGAQRLIHERLLPAALIYANPGFLRPCHGIHVQTGRYLHMHAADLARTADGYWWALADRTQAPSGAGYALENRIVLSRSMPEAFRDCQVLRLASFFRALRETLLSLAPRPTDNPRVVLLTSGPFNETYFEHAYLARYLGFTLVEGGDLTVRDQAVFMKTVEGLQPVDVVLRRLDDSFCDPLELRGDSFLGCAGLVEAARARQVTVANALGSGVVETAAILPFLPRLCRHFLGEDLKLPSVPTWWCGEPKAREYVLDHLHELVIKPAFSTGNREPIFGAGLSKKEREALGDQIRARPLAFVAQETMALSTAPVWLSDRLEPRSIMVRVYAAACGDTYSVMPGGLTRVASSPSSAIVSMQSGGVSKDTWVLSDRPVSPVTLLAASGAPVEIERAPKDLPSRVADNLFWLGRYAERCEYQVRIFRAATARLSDATTISDTPELSTMLGAMAAMHLVPAESASEEEIAALEQQILSVMFIDEPRPGLRDTLNQLRHVAWLVRDRLSGDAWRILNQLHQDLRADRPPERSGDGLVLLNRMIMSLAAFSGMEAENMTRGHGWRFLDIGRRLERAVMLATIVRAVLPPHGGPNGNDDAALWPLLEIADSGMTYRRRYFAQASLAPVLDLVLADDSIPRSFAFQLEALGEHVDKLPRDPRAPKPTREEALVASLSATVRNANIRSLCAARAIGEPGPLDDLLKGLIAGAERLSDTMTHYYFTHAVPRLS
jgi:uncharacterized circularly permuted ATP-grasp superfamily protein/uncharacterized alpha-E superfamily protein